MPKKKETKKHIVVFQDENGEVLKTCFVSHGKTAVPPEVPEKKGETAHHEIRFQGWSHDYSAIEENLVIKAVYQEVPKKYLVMYFHENGKVLGTETVAYQEAASMPYYPEKKRTEEFEYIFQGWNGDLSCIEKDTMAKAVFEERRRSFPVRFFHEDGTLIIEENVPYGSSVHAPEHVTKEADPVYHYEFAGWDADFSEVTEPLDVHAGFQAIYNEYPVSFYEEGNLIEETNYHFGELPRYPELYKKGYTLRWNLPAQPVEKPCEIHASWEFTNPKGRQVQNQGNIYEILNPSVSGGTVKCISFQSNLSRIQVPDEIKLGDYYYRITQIGPNAFSGCISLETLLLPDSVTEIQAGGLAHCRKLKKVILGKKLHSLGDKAFAGNEHLKEVVIRGKELRSVHRSAWERMASPVKVQVPSDSQNRYQKMFQRALRLGKVQLHV